MTGGQPGSQASVSEGAGGVPQHRGLAHRKSHAPPGKYDEDDPIPDEQEEGPAPVTVRQVFEGLFHTSHHEHANQVDIEHYIHDKSFRRRLILLSLSNSKIGVRMQLFRAIVFVIGCLLYVAEATYYDYWGEKIDISTYNTTVQRELTKFYRFFVYTDKPQLLWLLEVAVGLFGLVGVCVHLYTRVNDWSLRGVMKVLTYPLVIQFLVGIMYCVTLLYPPVLRNLFIPLFLLCWSARESLSAAIIQKASRQFGIAPKTFTIKAIGLGVFLICFTFTWVCLLHRVELVNTQLNFFDTNWFVLVTLSSVGYGDIHPVDYAGKLMVMLFIVLGFVVILPQLEELYNAFQMQQRLHNSVNYTDSRKHVILCSSELKPCVLRDFLAEFFADPKNLDVHCVLLMEKDLSPFMKVYLTHPVWSTRITIIIGSPMKRTDLARARADTAIACFIHTAHSGTDPEIADQHTVMSAWSVKNFSPACKLYVHVLLPETLLHLDLADQVLCEGEMKLALMANNVHCPGISTLVTLLLHTFKSEVHDLSSADYRLYDMCSSCEVYDSRVGDSKYFHHFIGKNFLFTSVVAYRKYQVTLLGVRPKNSRDILLNPGLHYTMDKDDICYYIGFTREEYSKVRETPPSEVRTALWQTCANMALLSLSIAGIDPNTLGDHTDSGKMDGPKLLSSRDSQSAVHSEAEERGGGGGAEAEKSGEGEIERVQSSSHISVQFHIPSETEDEQEQLVSEKASKEPSVGEGHTASESNVVRRGLKLLRFHSRMDIHANPVVKVKVSTPVTTPITCTTPLPVEEIDVASEDESDGNEAVFELQPSLHTVEEGRGQSSPAYKAQFEARPPLRSLRRSLRCSLSDHSLSEYIEKPRRGSKLDRKGIVYSSQLSLVQHEPPRANGSTTLFSEDSVAGHSQFFLPLSHVIRRMSSWNAHHPSSHGTIGDVKESEEVVLDLEDIAEEKELEELEDRRCGGDEEEEESDESDEEATPTAPPQPKKLTRTCTRHRYVKGCLPVLPYCGCDSVRFHLLPERRPHHLIRLEQQEASELSGSIPEEKVGVSSHWREGGVIVYSEEATEELYHLLLPLRAHYLHTAELRPIVLLLGKEPSPFFLGLVSPLPMVHYLTGDISSVDAWLRAGVLVCECAVITGGKRSTHDQEHMVDAAHILAAQKLAKLFPHVNVMTELHYRYNMRFLHPDNYIMRNLSGQRGDHLSYLFQPQFAAGQTFCASMLDTMLYQSHFKPYIVGLVRQLLGCQQINDSAYLWKLEVGEDLLKMQTYGRLFQRVVTTHHCVPLGLYRTVPLSSCPEFQKYYSEQSTGEAERYALYLRSRLEMMGGGELEDHVRELLDREKAVPAQSFVIVNPPPKTQLQEGDVLLTLRPHHRPAHPSPCPHLSTHPSSLSSHTEDTDWDSGVHYEFPSHPTLPTSPLHTLPTSPLPTPHPPHLPTTVTVTVTAECH